jgi:two-component system, cell cycle sensor histidine kinase and response regulator CckA
MSSPDPVNAPAGPEAKAAGADSSLALKQKLDCALQLARTVALDFNNALTSILGHTSLILSRMEPNHPWRESLLEVEKSAAKAAEIANDLGTFSRQEKETRSQTSGNLNSLLQRSVEFFQQNAGPASVTWTLQFDRRLFAAKFDEAKMQQAFMKVLENAIQAIKDHGNVTVQTRNIELAEATQDRNARLAAGAYVCAEISDNGCGIEPDVLPRVFEPFFTTKRGTHRGLGLAWVYGIVTNHGGGVAISSQPGSGTSVRIYLPAERRMAREEAALSTDLHGTQTVLIVDDEDLLLTMGKAILSSYGYRVLTANGGQKALEILSKKDPPVDLVITDLVMPAMSGRELVERIRKLLPALPIVCTSGYVWPAGQESGGAYLQKPFTSQELLLMVKRALQEQPAAQAE